MERVHSTGMHRKTGDDIKITDQNIHLTTQYTWCAEPCDSSYIPTQQTIADVPIYNALLHRLAYNTVQQTAEYDQSFLI